MDDLFNLFKIMITIVVTLVMYTPLLIISNKFRLRLAIPLTYFAIAIIAAAFNPWVGENEKIIFIILFIMLGIWALSWVYTLVQYIRNKRATEADLVQQFREAREREIATDNTSVDEFGIIIDNDTGEPLLK